MRGEQRRSRSRLLVEFDTDGSLELVFRKHKLLPLGEGLGSTAEEPHLHRIGHAGQPKLAVPVDVYGLWSFSWRDSDLWQACVLYADDSENVAEGDEPSNTTPQDVAQDLALHLPLMIAMGCGYLDPVPN
ncbi:hypothetical protein [Micromonospora sp. SH-82]|uniref:hypothetical protein n=1 Tax=Micromonospora sp. SH-82 TaxID=3132938 RepID=UPI003EBCE843